MSTATVRVLFFVVGLSITIWAAKLAYDVGTELNDLRQKQLEQIETMF